MKKQPTFLLKPSAYKADTLYAIVPDSGNGDMSVSSYVGNGTRVNSEGLIEDVASDTPRVDYHGGIGLLLEPTRTNLNTYSHQTGLTGGSWTSHNVVGSTGLDLIALDGQKQGVKLADSSVSATSASYKNIIVVDSTAVHTLSCFIMFGDRTDVLLRGTSMPSDVRTSYITFSNDGTATINDDGGGFTTDAKMEDYGGGWWRCSFVFDMADADTDIRWWIYPGTSYPQDVDQTGYCWVWGGQVEEGYYPTSYIDTGASGTTLTRLFDEFTLTNTITNGLIGETNGSLYVDMVMGNDNNDLVNNIVTLGSTNGRIYIYGKTSGTGYARIATNGSDTTTDTYTATTDNRVKVLFNLFGDSTEVWINGTKVLTSSKDLNLTSETLELQGQGSKAKIKEVAMYSSILSDTDSKAKTQ